MKRLNMLRGAKNLLPACWVPTIESGTRPLRAGALCLLQPGSSQGGENFERYFTEGGFAIRRKPIAPAAGPSVTV
jgi:hypothetical protein